MKEIKILENMIKSGKHNINEIINQLCEVSSVIAEKQRKIENLEKDNTKLHEYINEITHESNMYKRMIQGIIEY